MIWLLIICLILWNLLLHFSSDKMGLVVDKATKEVEELKEEVKMLKEDLATSKNDISDLQTKAAEDFEYFREKILDLEWKIPSQDKN